MKRISALLQVGLVVGGGLGVRPERGQKPGRSWIQGPLGRKTGDLGGHARYLLSNLEDEEVQKNFLI
jgi:hypothetical protein